MLRTPTATYRFQVHAGFTLDDVRERVAYLDALGISDVYLSPITAARPGTTHGYDVTDPRTINEEIGGRPAFEALSDAVRARGLGVLVDIVPNHMAASPHNPFWFDVLENGQNSPYARWFDIDWHPAALKGGLRGKLLVPILGSPYGEALEAGQLTLDLRDDGLFVAYYETRLPLALRTWAAALRPAMDGLAALPAGAEMEGRLRALLARAEALPRAGGERPDHEALRLRAELRTEILGLLRANPAARDALAARLREEGGRAGHPDSFDRLDQILGEQHYWLAFWRLAGQEINFRRFFNIADLVALRADDPDVFDAAHALVLELAREGRIDGFRIDHIDGLYDPAQYLRRLQDRLDTEPAGSPGRVRRPGFYVVVEKILAREETLPEDWACAGTTGYEFIDAVHNVLVDPAGIAGLDVLYRSHLGEDETFVEVRYARKKAALERLFGGETRALATQLGRLAALDRHARDLPQTELYAALAEVTACLPVYRTYVRDTSLTRRDHEVLVEALAEARRRCDHEAVSDAAFKFLQRVLLLEPIKGLAGVRRARLQFVMRWQQFTGAVMAKGLEDSTFYIYNRLVSLNEVGGEPELSDAEDGLLRFHRYCAERRRHWPGALNASSTHDTKRSEDVRARINVLTEIPDEWARAFGRFVELTSPLKEEVRGRPVPGPRAEFLLQQTLLGAWPFDPAERAGFLPRFQAYLLKAAREASLRTSYMKPDERLEQDLSRFAEAILDPGRSPEFLAAFDELFERVAYAGAVNALVQTLLKCTAPGVPDVYQGTETWDFSMVDPDNRRPVDFAARARMLAEVAEGAEGAGATERVAGWHAAYRDGRIKLHVLRAALRLRREQPALFAEGEYIPLQVTGPRRAHVIAFARRRGAEWAVVAAARWMLGLGVDRPERLGGECWGSTALTLPEDAPAAWHDRLSARAGVGPDEGHTSVPAARLFAVLPLALLIPH